MTLIQAFNDWGDVVSAAPIYVPFVVCLLYFLIYPIVENFDIIN